MPPASEDPRDPARSCFGVAIALIGACYLLTDVHGGRAHHEPTALVALVVAALATTANLVVGLREAANGRLGFLYLALAPVFLLVLVYDRVNASYGGAGGVATAGWLAIALLLGVEAWMLATLIGERRDRNDEEAS